MVRRRKLSLESEGRYDRQAISGWSQRRLGHAKVVVVGAGAIGNEVVKNLALVGVGTIAIIDFDRVAPSNLTRCVLMSDDDVGQPKAQVVARRASALNPDVRLVAIDGDVEFELGDSYLRDADLVVGCVDNAYARFVLNARVRRVGRGWLDTAISSDSAQVSLYGAHGVCYACGLGESTLRAMRSRFSCTGLRRVVSTSPVPTTVVTAAMAGSLATQITVDAIHGRFDPGSRWTMLLANRRWLQDELPSSDGCPFHPRRVSRLPQPSSLGPEVSWREVVTHLGLSADASLSVPHDVVIALRCPTCSATRPFVGPMGRLIQDLALCERCSSPCEAQTSRRVVLSDRLAAEPLSSLGYSSGDWLLFTDHGRAGVAALRTLPNWVSDVPNVR
jgi:molybdopterin/thiamine biosynthesis adenylyltransferase